MSRIKLHRQIEDNPLWFSEPFTRWQAWVDLLLLANHSDGFFYVRWNKIEVPRWCVWRAERTFQDRWKRSRDKVRKFLNDLEKSKNIIQQKNRLCSIYFIVNWDTYQTTDQTTEKPQKNHRKTNTRRIEENNIIIINWTTNFEKDESIKNQIKEIIPLEVLKEEKEKYYCLVELIVLWLKTEKTEKWIQSRIYDIEKKLEANKYYTNTEKWKDYDRESAYKVAQNCRTWNESQKKECWNPLNSFNKFLSNNKNK